MFGGDCNSRSDEDGRTIKKMVIAVSKAKGEHRAIEGVDVLHENGGVFAQEGNLNWLKFQRVAVPSILCWI